MKTAVNFGIVVGLALLVTLAPGGGAALGVILTLLSLAFFTAIAVLGFRLYREHRTFTLDAMDDRRRLLFYSAVGLAFLTFAASARLFSLGGIGLLAWLVLLALSSYVVFWVFTRRA